MSKKTEEEEKPLITEEEFRNIFDALINNYDSAISLHDAGDDALSTPEIMEILTEINPFISQLMVVKALKDRGFNFQFDLRVRQFKWLMKFSG